MNWSDFAGRSIYFEANIFIYAMEGGSPFLAVLKDLLEKIEGRPIAAAMSGLTSLA